ncbi:MAG: hypothetical protein ACFB2X_25725 [Rivularia sp. (in: cyanobacteria)]
MNQNFNNYENIQFKSWIKKRFINEIDINRISYKDALLWCEALQELSNELIDTIFIARLQRHEIVPFRRGKE